MLTISMFAVERVDKSQTEDRSRTLLYRCFIDLLSTYSDEKYKAIVLVPNCTCNLNFNFGHFVVGGK